MMLTALIEWRPISEAPETDEPIAAVLAVEDPNDGAVYLEYNLYLWQDGAWVNEVDGRVNTSATWWVPERELIQPITLAMDMARQRVQVASVAHTLGAGHG